MQANSVTSTAGTSNKLPAPVKQNEFGFWEAFWKKVYSYEVPSNTADKIIETGQKVAEVRDKTIDAAKKGVKAGLLFGPTIVIVLVLAYLFLPTLLSTRRP